MLESECCQGFSCFMNFPKCYAMRKTGELIKQKELFVVDSAQRGNSLWKERKYKNVIKYRISRKVILLYISIKVYD